MKFNDGFNPIHLEILRRSEEREDKHAEVGDEFGLNTPNLDPIEKGDYLASFSKRISRGDIILSVGSGMVDVTGIINHQLSTLIEVTKEKGAQLLISDIKHSNMTTHLDNKELRDDDHTHILVADATNLPLANESVNGVTSSNLINCHTLESNRVNSMKEQAMSLLQEFWRVLKPGGFVMITSFGYVRFKNKDGSVTYVDDVDPKDVVTLKDLYKYLENIGFVDIRELLPSDERIKEARHLTSDIDHSVEAGGFVARKPISL